VRARGHAGRRAEPVAEDAGVGHERAGGRAGRVRAVLPLVDREHRVAEALPLPLGRLEVGPRADELVVAHRLVEVAPALPLGRRRLHPGPVERRVPGVDAVVEDSDDDALAHVACVPQAAAAAPAAAHEPEHLRRVRGQELERLLGEGSVEPLHLGHLVQLLGRHAGGEAVDDAAVGVDEPGHGGRVRFQGLLGSVAHRRQERRVPARHVLVHVLIVLVLAAHDDEVVFVLAVVIVARDRGDRRRR